MYYYLFILEITFQRRVHNVFSSGYTELLLLYGCCFTPGLQTVFLLDLFVNPALKLI